MQADSHARRSPARIYAGIGARDTPPAMLAVIGSLASALAQADWTLSTGASPGADAAFIGGALQGHGHARLYLPWRAFQRKLWQRAPARLVSVMAAPSRAALELAARTHPAWRELSRVERLLAARDCHEVLGEDLRTPVAGVLCWTADGSRDGAGERREGTAQALRLARAHGIPVLNLALAEDLRRALEGPPNWS